MTIIAVLFFWLKGHNNMESGLSPQDKKDLDKFIKFFALKVRFVLLPLGEEVRNSFYQCWQSFMPDF